MGDRNACRLARHHASLAEKVAFLRQRSVSPAQRGDDLVIETHFAWIFLHGQLAYKLHKPVHRGSMDYRTLAARRTGCLRELRLNRRLAPRVYQNVVALVCGTDGELKLGGRGVVEDYLVQMQRLTADGMLDQLIRRHALSARQLDRLAATLRRFFATARRLPLAPGAYLQRLRLQILTDRGVLERWLPRQAIERLCAAQLEFVQEQQGALGARGAALIEGHGDLRPEHVHIGRRVNIIDCVEFDRELRRQDPMQELAQLAVQIEYLQRPRLAQALLWHCRVAGSGCPASIESFYLSLAALTRASLSAAHIDDPAYPDERPWLARARGFLSLAQRHLNRARRAARPGGRPEVPSAVASTATDR